MEKGQLKLAGLPPETTLYRVNLKNEQKGKGMEGKFGYLRSECVRLCLRISTANSGTNQEICRQERPEVQTFSVVPTKSLM
ncbi:hypothetical protein AMQ83_23710 [Paenibacillus riograndensis]|nr:hypothetical protein AMQ83_23710 [Paenibacillus riograndensis]